MKNGYFVLVLVALVLAPVLEQPASSSRLTAAKPALGAGLACPLPDLARTAWQVLKGAP